MEFINLKKNHSYYYQVIGQMLLTGCEWVDFYVYCKFDFHLERVRFDADCCSEMKLKLDTFYFEYLLPELLEKTGPYVSPHAHKRQITVLITIRIGGVSPSYISLRLHHPFLLVPVLF